MKIEIKGEIVSSDDKWIYNWFGIEATCPKDVNRALKDAKGEDLEIEINSPGGSVFAGSEIYTSLKAYPGNVVVKIVGIAASAASVIAMAGKKILMSPTAQIMIHNASLRAQGDYREMEHAAEFLKNVNETISNAYRLKTGLSEEELLAMMDKETWMTPKQALENKFIDEIMFSDLQVVATASQVALPQEVINKIRQMKGSIDELESEPQVDDTKKKEVENMLKEMDLKLAIKGSIF